jgi:hypothetical protein
MHTLGFSQNPLSNEPQARRRRGDGGDALEALKINHLGLSISFLGLAPSLGEREREERGSFSSSILDLKTFKNGE